jgi:phosphoglycolate phosphatase-like HAD superfamily hydrolase
MREHPRRMKNVNIFVDVDLTLIDEIGRLLPGAAEGLRRLKERGCRLFLWSTGGGDYCREVAGRFGLEELFEGFFPKPDIIIDDTPGMCLSPIVCDVNEEQSWPAMAERIVSRYVM